MTAEEKAKLAKMSRGKTPEQTREMLGRDAHAAHERIRTELRAERERAALNAKSKERVAELRQQITDRGLMHDPEIRTLVEGVTAKNRNVRIAMLRDKLISRIRRFDAERMNPGAEVVDGAKIYEKLPEATMAEWKASHPGEDPSGVTERADGVYMQRGEIDILIIERQPGGKAKVIVREEIKTGHRNTPAEARAQLSGQSELFQDGATGKRRIRLEVGDRDITDQIDLGSDTSAKKTTLGPARKGFDSSLNLTAEDLEKLCRDLLAEISTADRGTP